ncbi:ubiquitin-specific protease ubp1 [Spiromyces aspiralis]|uniref:Ubiquitin-specific protease ubp1 n=1 Tax=Spiromyces aspiralis TaxID=68401 RepID=A0ACC1HXV0_9FUNG|nr:ubiquitin-specific protease ubp1 [Spiromyces aspiralis]
MSLKLAVQDRRVALAAASVTLASILALYALVLPPRSSGISGVSKRQKRHGSKHARAQDHQLRPPRRGKYLISLATLGPFVEYLHRRYEECRSLPSYKFLSDEARANIAIITQLHSLQPTPRPERSIVPKDLIASFKKKAGWITSHSQQDAQEFFQTVSSLLDLKFSDNSTPLLDLCIDSETLDPTRNVGDGKDMLSESKRDPFHSSCEVNFKNPFIGLAASRVACALCGYTSLCTIEDCLRSYTVIDHLSDFKCRKCSIFTTLALLEKRLQSLINGGGSSRHSQAARSKLERHVEQLRNIIDSNDFERDIGDIPLHPSDHRQSTKHTMLARTPHILCLHLSRSIFLPTGHVVKNQCRVRLQAVLDLSEFSTTGHIDTNPWMPLSHDSDFSRDAEDDNYDVENTEEGGRWLRISDTDVTQVNECVVLQCMDAYMLFYQRLNPS